jgi:hypothetical protein
MADSPQSRLASAAIAGLAMGLVIASAVLAVKAVLAMQVDCTGLGIEECVFAREVGAELARTQGFAAFGCLALGLGLGLAMRSSRRKAAEPESPQA